MDIFGQTFVFFVVYDWNHTAAFASLLLGCAVISLPLMPLFGIGMTKLGLRWNGDAFPGLCRRLGLCGWIGNTFPGMLRTMVRLAAFHIAGAATGTDFDDRTGVQQ